MIRPLLLSLCLLCFCLVSIRAEVMDLAGDWQARPLNGSWPPVSLPDDGKDAVQTVLVPNAGWSHPEHAVDEEMLLAAGGVVISRTIIVSPEASARTPVLRWESLLWSHRVFVDGELVGGRDHYAPGQLNLPRLGAGEHRLSIVLANLSSLPRGEAGHYLLPVGSGDKSWGRKKSSVGGALDLRFVDGERIDAVLMMPDLVHERVRVRLDSSLLGQEAGADQRQVAIRITDPDGAIVVDARHAHSGIGSRVIFTHPIPDPKPWHPDSPQCYRVSVSISDADGLRDRYESTFGMRTFQVVDGDFQLNGAYHPILGTNVVVDWLKGPDWFHDRDGKLTDFYIDRAQGMNAGTLRTHTLPPNHRVAAICDAGGTMLLAEMPLTYNGADYDFTEAEEQQYRDAAEEMQAAWVQGLGNHPSIIMWVPINEPTMGNVRGLRDWQEQRLEPALRELDPTREVLQAADLSQTIADVHNYSGFWDGAEGDFHERLRIHARNAGLDGVQRALFNSEYIEGMWGKRRYRWAGPDEDFASYWRIYSHIGHEQTDAMRVLGYDGILPYWMAAWTWTPKEGAHRDWAPTMMYAAQKSSLARATAVVDLFDRNHEPRSLLGVPVVLVNDHATARQLHCELHLVSENPGFDPDWDGFTAETRIASISRSMASGERHTWLVPVELPATGNHYLAAVTRVDDEAVAVSQRIIRITAPQVPTGLRERSITVLGADAAVIAGLQDLGLDVRSGLGSGMPTSDLILVWSDAGLDPHSAVFRSWANAWLSDGGRMLFLAQKHWDDGGFAHLPTDVHAERGFAWSTTSDRSGAVHEVDAGLLQDLDARSLLRWNGRNGVLSQRSLVADWLPDGSPIPVEIGGPMITRMDQLLISGSAISEHDLVMQETWMGREPVPSATLPLSHAEGGRFLLHRPADPDPGASHSMRWQVDAGRPYSGRLWLFGMGNLRHARFQWRLDEGAWQTAPERKPVAPQRMGFERIWFAWQDMGLIDLPAGQHTIDLRFSGTDDKPITTLGIDCLLISPEPSGTIHARSGSGEPVIARHPAGAGAFVVSQLAFDGRLFPDEPAYDPAALHFFLQLLEWSISATPDADGPEAGSGSD